MKDYHLSPLNNLKLKMLQVVMVANNYNLEDIKVLKIYQQFAKDTNIEIDFIMKFSSSKIETFNLTNSTILHISDFINEIRNLIDSNGNSQGEGNSSGSRNDEDINDENNSKKELNNILIYYQYILLNECDKIGNMASIHTIVLTRFINLLLVHITTGDKLNNDEIVELAAYLKIDEGQINEMDLAQIKTNYHAAALKFHPDKNGNSEESKVTFEKFKALYDRFIKKFAKTNLEEIASNFSSLDLEKTLCLTYKNVLGQLNDDTRSIIKPKIVKTLKSLLGRKLDGSLITAESANHFLSSNTPSSVGEYFQYFSATNPYQTADEIKILSDELKETFISDNHEKLKNRVWYQNNIKLLVGFINIISICAITLLPRDLSLMKTVSYIKNDNKLLYSFAFCSLAYSCLTGYNKLSKVPDNFASRVHDYSNLATSLIPWAILIYSFVGMCFKGPSKMIVASEWPLGIKISGINIAINTIIGYYQIYKDFEIMSTYDR